MLSGEDVVTRVDSTLGGSRRLRVLWYTFAAGFCLFLVPTLREILVAGRPVAAQVALTVVVLAYGVGYAVLTLWGLGRALVARAAIVAGMCGLYLVVIAGVGSGQLTIVTFALVAAAILIGFPWSMLVCAVLIGGVVLLGAVSGAPVDADQGRLLMAVALGSALAAGAGRLYVAMQAARSEIARLAVIEERERLYRDLHDVLGHGLTAITVKAGLARRLLESGATERAGTEVADVERLSRDALAEVRTTVAGRRTVTLAGELATARELLAAAAIAADLPDGVDAVAAAYRVVFGYVVREGVTNVVRHSGASTCSVRVGPGWVEVRDDGRARPDGMPVEPGNGLGGLAARLASIGGRCTAEPLVGGGFRLRAEVPGAPR